jgi:hypothetical protein
LHSLEILVGGGEVKRIINLIQGLNIFLPLYLEDTLKESCFLVIEAVVDRLFYVINAAVLLCFKEVEDGEATTDVFKSCLVLLRLHLH